MYLVAFVRYTPNCKLCCLNERIFKKNIRGRRILLVIILVCMSAINGCTPINNQNACICNHCLGNYQCNKVCYIKPKITT